MFIHIENLYKLDYYIFKAIDFEMMFYYVKQKYICTQGYLQKLS